MPDVRVLMMRYSAIEPPRERIVNTLHFKSDFIGESYDSLATDVVNAFKNLSRPSPLDTFEARVYKLSDSEPRPIVGSNKQTVVPTQGSSGPREVALCLSFYAGRNLPRSRGRVYCGPFLVGEMAERPNSSIRANLGSLATALAAAGGAGYDWSVRSTRDNMLKVITNWWVDDEWDTVRSRGRQQTTRTIGTTGQ
jgi:hypothetical protein